jgi:hypothetical protein
MSNLRRRKAGGADAAAPAAGAAAGVAKEKRIGPLIAAVVLGGGALVLADRQHGLGAEQKLQGVLLLTAVAIAVLFATCPPLPQPLAYHNFADQRCLCCGVPNTFDVLSNIPFLLVSALGLDHVMGGRMLAAAGADVPPPVFADRGVELPLWITFFAGVGLIALGSGYYHWRPSNERLVWDRLPMTVAFMSFLSVVLTDTVVQATAAATNSCLGVLVIIGLASVAYWDRTDDLRLYVLVQFYSLALIPLLISLFPSRYDNANVEYLIALAFYVGAKIAEALDKKIFRATGRLLSGHTLKHLLSGVTTFYGTVVLLRRRQRV